MARIGKRVRSTAGMLLAIATLTVVLAQGVPYVPPELYQELRRLQGDKITVCVWPALSPTAPLDRDVASAVSAVLLIDVDVYEYPSIGVLSPDEFLEEVYIQLGAHCDAIAGFTLVADVYPEWLVPTRPYLHAPFVALVRQDSGYARLGDVSAGAIIGSQIYTEGDYQLISYLLALPEGQRWRRFPYASADLLGRHVAARTIEAGLVWQPSWVAIADEDYASGLAVVPASPVPGTVTGVGFALRSDNDYLRSVLDIALGSMADEGLLGEIAAMHGYQHVEP
jgi:polar amino acid transport system substrate-binding protein